MALSLMYRPYILFLILAFFGLTFSLIRYERVISEDIVVCGPLGGKCSLKDRERLHVELSAFGTTFTFNLVPSQPITTAYGEFGVPVMVVGDGAKTVKMINFNDHNVQFYHDLNSLAAFAVKFETINNTEVIHSMDGVLPGVNEDIVISPIWTSESKWHNDGGVVTKHKVTKRVHAQDNLQVLNDAIDLRRRDSNSSPMTTKSSQNIAGTVEVLVWTDYSMYESFRSQVGPYGNVEAEVTWYVAIVVNAANKIYQLGIRDPSLNISLSLAGTVICSTRNCSRYTEDHRINNTVNNHVALTDFATMLSAAYKETNIHFRFDQATAMTRLDIVDPQGTPIGVAFTDKICSLADGKSSSLVEDQGAFSCVQTFAHEIAHNLGSDHDGWGRSRSCNANDGYIMSALSPLVQNGFYFSQCSVDSMKQNLLKPTASCIHDTLPENHLYLALTSTMPGQVYNVTEQCNAIYGTGFCLSVGTTLEDICHKMYCWDPVLNNVCSTKSAAALGTSCGFKQWCVEGQCVHDKRAPL